ncbi:MAG: hypothetical protein ACOX6U_00090 [Oscillospiraceae bacterium]|jgi:hypothetical protein
MQNGCSTKKQQEQPVSVLVVKAKSCFAPIVFDQDRSILVLEQLAFLLFRAQEGEAIWQTMRFTKCIYLLCSEA